MKKFKVRFLVFGNFGSHMFLNLDDNYTEDIVRKLVFDKIKDEDWDWELTIDDVEIIKIIEI
jgi:hypothetical protein